MKKTDCLKKQAPGYILFALLVLFVGSFAVHGNLLEGTLASAFIPVETNSERAVFGDVAEKVTAEEVKKTQSEYRDLVERIKEDPRRIEPLPTAKIDLETLWLARCIYSETKRPEEMELVAWVVRNRVETRYRGRDSYREVVLDPFQFSAFNPNNGKRWFYSSLDTKTQIRSWQKALTIAYRVRLAEPEYRPFSVRTRHFFSERSMVGRQYPEWAIGKNPVSPTRPFRVDARRFRFYEDIS